MSRVDIGFVLQPDDAFLDRTDALLDACDYAEIAPETTWHVEAGVRRENGFHRRFREIGDRHGLDFVAHGVGYSLGDSGGEARRALWRRWVAQDHVHFGFRWYTDHLGATAIGPMALTLPVALPWTNEVADRVRTRLDEMASVVPVAGIENTVAYFTLSDPMNEPAWLNETLRSTDHHLLLDVHNVFTMATNFGFDADAWIARLDLENVIEFHVSGGAVSDPRWLESGRTMRLDAHSHAVPEAVFELLERWAPRCPNLRGITLERMEGTVVCDADVEELAGELARVRVIRDALQSEAEAEAESEAEAEAEAEAESEAEAVDVGPSAEVVERAIAALVRASDPVATLRDAGLRPNDDDGVRLTALLATRLRFERLVRGSGQADKWFEEAPEDFTATFHAYHADVPMTAFFPADEARAFEAWLRSRQGR